MIYLDTETCGLCGPAVILQYAKDDGPIRIHNFWTETVGDSMSLIKEICADTVVGFNLAFDWFQIAKMYTMLEVYLNKHGDVNAAPVDHIETFALLESEARYGSCVKPKSAVDLMLVARKTKYQITMNRGDIRIRRVPTILATRLAKHLEKEIVLQNILFARRKDRYAPKWRVYDTNKRIGNQWVNDPDFKDVVLKFKPSVALKALAIDALGVHEDNVLLFKDVEVDREFLPNEIPYAPFAQAIKDYKLTKKNATSKEAKRIYQKRHMPWRWAWPDVIHKHISHWEYYEPARAYANKDVEYTRGLFKYFDCPADGDDDSVLACAVGAVRWKGYSVDLDGLVKLKEEARAKMRSTPMAPGPVKYYLGQVLEPAEQEVLKDGTGKVILQELASWKNKECPMCSMLGDGAVDPDCSICRGTNSYTHPVADRAQEVLDARLARKEIELYDKLLLARRFHASFKVIGTLSSRMAGADGLNAQGIKRDTYVRKNFTFADEGWELEGGDFDGFEVVIAEAAYNDPDLRAALLKKAICPGCLGKGEKKGKTCKDCNGEGQTGQKIHGLFAMELFPGVTYEEVVKSKGSKKDMYDYGKRGVFSQVYGGDENTLVKKLGVSLEVARRAATGFAKRFPGVGRAQKRIFDMFCSMRQPGGIGTKVEWHDPNDYIESLLGFRRYFTLENMVCKSLFNLANSPPKDWKRIGSKIKVQRRDREQSASGAMASALYSAAFQLQAANMRAASNHVIQSTGAQITKAVQRQVWEIQPAGIHKWAVQPCNVHDEILCVMDPALGDKVKETVDASVDSFRSKISLLKMEWKDMRNWGEK
jgi:hypothetical protein